MKHHAAEPPGYHDASVSGMHATKMAAHMIGQDDRVAVIARIAPGKDKSVAPHISGCDNISVIQVRSKPNLAPGPDWHCAQRKSSHHTQASSGRRVSYATSGITVAKTSGNASKI